MGLSWRANRRELRGERRVGMRDATRSGRDTRRAPARGATRSVWRSARSIMRIDDVGGAELAGEILARAADPRRRPTEPARRMDVGERRPARDRPQASSRREMIDVAERDDVRRRAEFSAANIQAIARARALARIAAAAVPGNARRCAARWRRFRTRRCRLRVVRPAPVPKGCTRAIVTVLRSSSSSTWRPR